VKGPVHRELEAWGPLVEAIAATYGYEWREAITEREAEERRALLRWLLLNTPVA
jgi:hypothetical protein